MFLLRAALLVAHLAWGVALAFWIAVGGGNLHTPEQLGLRWHRRLLKIFGITVRVEGEPLLAPHMTVSNHVSWLDIPVLGSIEPTRFVSKSEVRDWPIAGWLAAAGGTFFLRRGKGGATPLLTRLVPHLQAAGSVVLFPEGTTTDGGEVRTFHPRLFAAAIDAQRPVQPVTLRYSLSPDGYNVAPFVGEDSLAAHILRLLQVPQLEVVVRYGPPLKPGQERDALAQEAESYVRGALEPPRRPTPPAPAVPRFARAA